jgi:hypothetical protein
MSQRALAGTVSWSSGVGSSQVVVRAKTLTFSAISATFGMNWHALAPVPITPTLLPCRSAS